MERIEVVDSVLWRQRAMAFAIRSYRHLWGKKSEDALAFLFQKGLSNDFAKSIYLGWNKHGQKRRYDHWGLRASGPPDAGREKDIFSFPSGIVFPHIVDETLLSIWIYSMNSEGAHWVLPGSKGGPVLFGQGNHALLTAADLFEGLYLYQEKQASLCVRIF